MWHCVRIRRWSQDVLGPVVEHVVHGAAEVVGNLVLTSGVFRKVGVSLQIRQPASGWRGLGVRTMRTEERAR
jgi:hypothetical protein